ncbi:outer membrane beta-barrel protein [Halocola ammonii]
MKDSTTIVMRIFVLSFFILLSNLSALAQMETSVIAGINMGTHIEKGGRQSSDISIDYNPGFNIGFSAVNQVTDQLSIDCALLLEQKGATREEVIPLASSSIINTNDVRLYYATVPLRAQFRLEVSEENFLIVGAGFYGSIGLLGRGAYTTKTNDDEITRNYKVDWWSGDVRSNDEFSNLDFGLTAQLGFQFKRVRIELNYDRGIRNIYSAPTRQLRKYNQTFRLSLGYELRL